MAEPTRQQLIADLARAFPRQRFDADTIRVYLRELKDIPVALLNVAVRELIRTSEWFPTVRALRERAAEHQLALPGEAEALSQIEARMRHTRERLETEPPVLHPLVRQALDHVGGFAAFRGADEPGVVRGQFGRLYRELRARTILDAQLGVQLPPGKEIRQLDP